MCIICTKRYGLNLTELNCKGCKLIKKIPEELINLKHLDCKNTKIKEIPKELINLDYLCIHKTRIQEIPKELNKIIYLFCDETPVKEIPKELINLKYLHCIYNKVTKIPKELIHLKFLNCIRKIDWDKSWIKTKEEKQKIVKLQRFWKKNYKFIINLPILWKIAEYYTAKKYSPENILKYIKLE